MGISSNINEINLNLRTEKQQRQDAQKQKQKLEAEIVTASNQIKKYIDYYFNNFENYKYIKLDLLKNKSSYIQSIVKKSTLDSINRSKLFTKLDLYYNKQITEHSKIINQEAKYNKLKQKIQDNLDKQEAEILKQQQQQEAIKQQSKIFLIQQMWILCKNIFIILFIPVILIIEIFRAGSKHKF